MTQCTYNSSYNYHAIIHTIVDEQWRLTVVLILPLPHLDPPVYCNVIIPLEVTVGPLVI